MTHACIWASDKGRELKLSCPERVTLWQLAERAATKGLCWPSLMQLREDTGLAKQTLLTVVKKLASLGLIRVEKDGQRQIYHLLRPVQDQPDRSKSEPVAGPKVNLNRSKSEPRTGLNLNPNLKENQKENLKGEEAAGEPGEAAAGQRAEAAPSAAPGRLMPSATWGGPRRREEREPTQAEVEANRNRQLLELARDCPEIAKLVGGMAGAWRHTSQPIGPSP